MVWRGACGPEHADLSMPTGQYNWKGKGKELFVLWSVYILHICMGMESCRREHVNGSMWM